MISRFRYFCHLLYYNFTKILESFFYEYALVSPAYDLHIFKVLNFDPSKDYKVKAGDTFSSIAAANGVTVDELKALNPGKDPNALIVCRLSLFVYIVGCV